MSTQFFSAKPTVLTVDLGDQHVAGRVEVVVGMLHEGEVVVLRLTTLHAVGGQVGVGDGNARLDVGLVAI